jgi:small subunit ribosomal protein S17
MADQNQTQLKGVRTGVVDSDVRDKTRRVVIEYRAPHPKYGKYVSKRTRFHIHDENNESKVGDIVEFIQCRPISKSKTWKLLRVVNKAGE